MNIIERMLALVKLSVKKIKKTEIEMKNNSNLVFVEAQISRRKKARDIKRLAQQMKKEGVQYSLGSVYLEKYFKMPPFKDYLRLRQADVLAFKIKKSPKLPVFIDSDVCGRFFNEVLDRCAKMTNRIYIAPCVNSETIQEEYMLKRGIAVLTTEHPPANSLETCFKFSVDIPKLYRAYKPENLSSCIFAGMIWYCTRDKNVSNWPITDCY